MNRRKQLKGIALIQVLLITGILSVLVLYLSQTSRQQVKLAQMSQERVRALVKLHSAESKLAFELLTRSRLNNEVISSNADFAVSDWNFYSQPFSVLDNVDAQLQDQAGLLSLHFLDCSMLIPVLEANGINYDQAYQLCMFLLDWQDIDQSAKNGGEFESDRYAQELRNGLIPDWSDLSSISQVSEQQLALLKQVLTLHNSGWFNPVNSPPEVLRSLITDASVQQVESLRKEGNINESDFPLVTGIAEGENIWFRPSSVVSVELTSQVGRVTMNRQWVWGLNPYAEAPAKPINILSKSGQ